MRPDRFVMVVCVEVAGMVEVGGVGERGNQIRGVPACLPSSCTLRSFGGVEEARYRLFPFILQE